MAISSTLGRADKQVKVRGSRIEVREIEIVLCQHPDIKDVAVVVCDAAESPADKRLTAYMVASQAEKITASEMRRFLLQKLPDYMVPSSYVLLDALPLTPNGKIDRLTLVGLAGDKPLSARAYVGPRTSVEQILVEISAHVLGVGQVGIHDNFFDLGGHSLLAIRLASRVRTAFLVDLPLRCIFEASTIAALAEQIHRLTMTAPALTAHPIKPVVRGNHSPLAKDQYQVWLMNQQMPNTAFFNLTEQLHLKGILNVEALVQSLSEITRRHEALRTTFPIVDGKPLQLINTPYTFKLSVIESHNVSERDRETCLLETMATEAHRPFDLTVETPLRATLLSLGPKENVLLFTMHHIMWDGWSIDIFGRELGILYEAFTKGKSSPLKDLSIQYGDFAVWQEQWLTSSAKEQQLNYWKWKLTGLTRLNFQGNHTPASRSFRYSRKWLRLTGATTSRIRAVSRQEDATVFMMLVTALYSVLHIHTKSEDVAVATQCANRNRIETEELIGLFANTLVLRADLSDNPTYSDLLQRVRQVAIEGYCNQDLPFDFLMATLLTESSSDETVHLRVSFLFDNPSRDAFQLHDLSISRVHVKQRTTDIILTAYDLVVQAEDTSEGLSLVFVYNTDVFEEVTIDQMISDYRGIVENIPLHINSRIRSSSILRATKHCS